MGHGHERPNLKLFIIEVLKNIHEHIEEVWKQKPRQTVVVALWGKIAKHMASIKEAVSRDFLAFFFP